MSEDRKITMKSIKERTEDKSASQALPSQISFEAAKNLVNAAVRKDFFLIETKLEAVKAVWLEISAIEQEQDKVSLLLSESIGNAKVFSTYSCNPFSEAMRLQPQKTRNGMALLQIIMESDKSPHITPKPPTNALRNLAHQIRAIRSVIRAAELEDERDDDECLSYLLTDLIQDIKKMQQSINELWVRHFPVSD